MITWHPWCSPLYKLHCLSSVGVHLSALASQLACSQLSMTKCVPIQTSNIILPVTVVDQRDIAGILVNIITLHPAFGCMVNGCCPLSVMALAETVRTSCLCTSGRAQKAYSFEFKLFASLFVLPLYTLIFKCSLLLCHCKYCHRFLGDCTVRPMLSHRRPVLSCLSVCL